MDAGAKKLLETATIETLHAHHFSRASTQATTVLTDLLSRYLTVLSSTCAKYAEHAGRLRLTARDAVCALDELGVGMEELSEYCATEGREMSRYAVHTARRVEDLNEFKAALSVGLREDRDDAIHLVWDRVPEYLPSDEELSQEEESESEEEETAATVHRPDDTMDVDSVVAEDETQQVASKGKGKRIASPRPLTPPLPLSPISNPSTPPRKRPRSSGWNPPPHIPDFLPPFPSHTPRHTPSPPPIALPPAVSSLPSAPVKVERPITPPPELASTTADYRTPVPYNISVLASQLPSHLPARPVTPPPPPPPPHQLPEIQPSLYGAYHYALTHPPSKELGPTNPARYKVAVALIEQMERQPRWEPASSLYGLSITNAPRVNAIGPSFPIPLNQDEKLKGKETDESKLPPAPNRVVIANDRVVPLISQQASRMHSLAKQVLPASVYNRTTKLGHPPPLVQEGRRLTYGPGVPAQWNGPVAAPAAPQANGVKKEKDGKDKDAAPAKLLPDAKLYATWNWEQKSYRDPVRSRRISTVQLPGTMGNGRRASRSESAAHM